MSMRHLDPYGKMDFGSIFRALLAADGRFGIRGADRDELLS